MASKSNTAAQPEKLHLLPTGLPSAPFKCVHADRNVLVCNACTTIAWKSEREYNVMMAALEESVRLQSHYADLLNIYDDGHRAKFESAEAWVKRLRQVTKPIDCRRR